jgi:hypothetical protein
MLVLLKCSETSHAPLIVCFIVGFIKRVSLIISAIRNFVSSQNSAQEATVR